MIRYGAAMKTSESIVNLVKALIEFQNRVPKIERDKKGQYDYASLEHVLSLIKAPLVQCNLAVIQGCAPSGVANSVLVTTRVAHVSGEWIETSMEMPSPKSGPQGMGTAITYARRYLLNAVLNIAPDIDTDAQDHEPEKKSTSLKVVAPKTTSQSKQYDPGEYVMKSGKGSNLAGKALVTILETELHRYKNSMKSLQAKLHSEGKELHGTVLDDLDAIEMYLASKKINGTQDEIPFPSDEDVPF